MIYFFYFFDLSNCILISYKIINSTKFVVDRRKVFHTQINVTKSLNLRDVSFWVQYATLIIIIYILYLIHIAVEQYMFLRVILLSQCILFFFFFYAERVRGIMSNDRLMTIAPSSLPPPHPPSKRANQTHTRIVASPSAAPILFVRSPGNGATACVEKDTVAHGGNGGRG